MLPDRYLTVLNHTIQAQSSFQPLTMQAHEFEWMLSRVNPKSASEPDSVPGKVLRACAGRISCLTTNFQPLHHTVHHPISPEVCHHRTSTQTKSATRNTQVVLNQIITKCLEQLALSPIKICLPHSTLNSWFTK